MTPVVVVPDPRSAWRDARTGPNELLAGGLLLAAVMIGTWTGWLPGMALLAVGVIGLVAAIVDPRMFLLAYVALIPFEGSTAFGGITNASRFAGIAFAAGYLVHRRTAIRLDTIPAAGWAFAAFASASFLWSIDRTASLPQIFTLLQLFLIAVLIADFIVQEERAARWVALAYAVSAVGTALIGLWIWGTARGTLVAGRATAFAGQDAAQFTAVLIPGLLVLVWETLRRPRILPIIGAAIIAVAMLASGTRSAWVAIGLAVLAGFLPRISMRQRISVGIAFGVVALTAFLVPPLYAETYGRLSDAISSGGTGRTDIWTIGLRLWTDHPAVGVGYGAFPSALTLEAIRATAIPTPDTGFLTPPVASHSIIVGTLLELGVVGFGCVVAFLWSVARPHRSDVSLAEIARLAVLTMIVQALFLDVLGRKQLWLFIALAGGLTVARAVRHREVPAEAGSSGALIAALVEVPQAEPSAAEPVPSAAAEPVEAVPAAVPQAAPVVAAPVVAWVRTTATKRPRPKPIDAPAEVPETKEPLEASSVPAPSAEAPAEPEPVATRPPNIVMAPPPGDRHNIVMAPTPLPPVKRTRRTAATADQLELPVESEPQQAGPEPAPKDASPKPRPTPKPADAPRATPSPRATRAPKDPAPVKPTGGAAEVPAPAAPAPAAPGAKAPRTTRAHKPASPLEPAVEPVNPVPADPTSAPDPATARDAEPAPDAQTAPDAASTPKPPRTTRPRTRKRD